MNLFVSFFQSIPEPEVEMTFSPASGSQALGLKACYLTCQVDGPGHLIYTLILKY